MNAKDVIRSSANLSTMVLKFSLIATHPMMHAGQFVVVRRQLGKPILM
jgi:hypothetical protein